MPGGITSQYGFLFQRYVFIKTVLDYMGNNRFFVYEGTDDIDVIEDDKIVSIGISNNYIQVKSGTVSKDCWAKIIGNWLLTENENENYKALLENNLSFDVYSNEVIESIYSYYVEGKMKNSTSIANRVYKKYINGKEKTKAEVEFKSLLSDIMGKVSIEVISMEDIKNQTKGYFANVYCQDIKVYTIAKECRYEYFIECIQAEIDASIENKKPYVLRYMDFIRIIDKVKASISDKKYNIDTTEMKKRKKPEAEQLLADNSIREVRQLRLVNNNDNFILGELLKELLYKDFRNVYMEPDSTEIANIEDIAYTNYEDALYSLQGTPKADEVFYNTVKREIPSSIIGNSPLYKNGCYVFLSGEEGDCNKQITWGPEDE